MQVDFSPKFLKALDALDEHSQDAVADFVNHVEVYGFKGLVGRNKSSAAPNPSTKRERADFAYAQKHCLWHYHIGIPSYVGEHGDMTSQYILHYQRFDEHIVLVALTAHPPFVLPAI